MSIGAYLKSVAPHASAEIDADRIRRALQITSAVLQHVATTYDITNASGRWKITHEGEVIANCTIAEALDLANEALEPGT